MELDPERAREPLGLGFVVFVPRAEASHAVALLEAAGQPAYAVGEVVPVPPDTEFEARVRFTGRSPA